MGLLGSGTRANEAKAASILLGACNQFQNPGQECVAETFSMPTDLTKDMSVRGTLRSSRRLHNRYALPSSKWRSNRAAGSRPARSQFTASLSKLRRRFVFLRPPYYLDDPHESLVMDEDARSVNFLEALTKSNIDLDAAPIALPRRSIGAFHVFRGCGYSLGRRPVPRNSQGLECVVAISPGI
ncbi:hypothetical protein OKW36_007527 [Paraburkholderia sp. MM5482-R1]